jgi:L-lactate dehydrogenase complex protein LldE
VAYHASCHGLRGLGIEAQPRQLLDNVKGIEQTALPGAEECCGFGGLFAVKMGDISGAILARKLDNIEASGAEIITGTDVSCLMNIAGGLQRRGSRVRVKHLAELLRGEGDE